MNIISMKIRNTFYLILINFLTVVNSSGQNYVWVKQYEGSSPADVYGISLDESGNIYTMGWLDGTVDFDPGPGVYNLTSPGNYTDVFITKSDASGNLIWAKQLESTAIVYGYAMTTDGAGNVYTTGWFNETADFDPGPGVYNLTAKSCRDVFISKLDPSGNFVWAKQLSGIENERGYGITVDQSGNVYTTGMFEDAVDFDPGPGSYLLTSVGISDIFISKLDASGNFKWAVQFGSEFDGEEGRGVVIDQSGNVYSTGWFLGTADFDPGPGIFSLTTAGDEDIFVSKLDSSGNFIWAKNAGGAYNDRGYAIAIDNEGNSYITGTTETGYDPAFLLKYNSNGSQEWMKTFGASFCSDITIDSEGNTYIIGCFQGITDFDPGPGYYLLTSAGYQDAFISKFDENGNHQWAGQFGGTMEVLGRNIQVDNALNIYSTGVFSGTADFDPEPATVFLTSAGGSDVYIHKMKPFTVAAPDLPDAQWMKVYPNPTESIITLQFNQCYATLLVTVRNIYGQVVTVLTFYQSDSIIIVMPENPGLYIMEVKTDNNLPISYKILKN
jgi:hypothetical protein